MNISFVVKDEIAADLIAACKWSLGNPTADDTVALRKVLKAYIGGLIDEHKRFVAVGADEAEVATLKNSYNELARTLMAKENEYLIKKYEFESSRVATDPDSL